MFNGIIFADSPPAHVTGYAWVKVLPDGSREWYSLDKDSQQWVLDNVESPPGLGEQGPKGGPGDTGAQGQQGIQGEPGPSGGDVSDINFTGIVSADGSAGLTGVKTLGGFKFTFKKGLLVGFEAV